MDPSRRGQPRLSVRLPSVNLASDISNTVVPLPDLPPISALFLIDFDVKAGYTIAWKQAAPGIELEGLVEYKSLPSGLHTVSDDLIYFVHEGAHAGLSAFVNMPCDEEDARNARMIAVGVLVPLSYGRLGRAWRHADGLKELAVKLAEDRKRTGLLEAYWSKAKSQEEPVPDLPRTDALLESPLVGAHTPKLKQRLRPLFSIGVHDINFLQEDFEASKRPRTKTDDNVANEAGTGWVACTTDSILAMKDTLWDMLITMPPPYAPNAKERVWPTVECPQGVPVRATQRDLRRFRALKGGLSRLKTTTPGPRPAAESPPAEHTPGIHLTTGAFPSTGVDSDEALDKIVEPISWTALAYSGFLWWASAGEQGRSDEQEEAALDASLLADLGPSTPSMSAPSSGRRLSGGMGDSVNSLAGRRATLSTDDDEARTELAIIAYFHRLTTQMLSVMADAVDNSEQERYEDDEDEDTDAAVDESEESSPLQRGVTGREELGPVQLGSHAVESMGLDVWNGHDAHFVRELAALYFDREVRIEGKGVEVCGVRVC
ncbi:uncharacterized protein VDAG_09773 [Verticillium dahliae VdLs.17]|uniref:DUF4484 domain-containing protein n=1 Tax=Verticillium dahliae (strain VdLs.17 / ATCC MYA-4575 / FGSC 10137) TaxID=498257 RepID=G2XHL9_VERDV|nr:uncharacterized protein VDAG_09773 [Verticillium dahliae VdLs.17]EGY19313.1 hypothetical protein VDAG_09773 [Verticillium dahliae VdLs.17]